MTAPSSAGLFAATGKSPKPVAVRDPESGQIVKADRFPRDEHDFEPTTAEVTQGFLAHERHHLVGEPVWEAAAGDGQMVHDLRQSGLDVIASDLIDRGCGAAIRDFYAYRFEDRPARKMVTNPPFKEVNWQHGQGRWLLHALEVLKLDYMALLLPQNVFNADGMTAIWRDHRPSRIYFICWRINFRNQTSSNPASHAWFVWDRAANFPEPITRRITRSDAIVGAGQTTFLEPTP